jgi:acyl-CoA thioester hydrolase
VTRHAGNAKAPVPVRLYRLSDRRTQSRRTFAVSRPPPGRRADYRWFHAITTRWMDNDVFRHVNNVNYFSFFDTAVTYYEMTSGVVDLLAGPVHCVVAEVMCRYHSSVAFPDRISVGIRLARIGASSVRYEIGVFRNDDDVAAAEGYFVHVFVDRATQRPALVPEASRAILREIAVNRS